MRSGKVISEQSNCEPWTVHLIDTGQNSNTGGRVKRMEPYIEKSPFFITYGDGVSNINIKELLDFHRSQKKMVTITAVRPPARFGGLELDGENIVRFTEKPQTGEGWINGGFMVCEHELMDIIKDDKSSLEADGLDYLAKINQIAAYRHYGFWNAWRQYGINACLNNYGKMAMHPGRHGMINSGWIDLYLLPEPSLLVWLVNGIGTRG